MTVVLVHGNPETDGIWEPLVDALGARDVVRLSPPGFCAPVPPGWRATPTAYRDWLAAKLEALAQPVDLVGHDWGGAHVVGVAMTRPNCCAAGAPTASAGSSPTTPGTPSPAHGRPRASAKHPWPR